MTESTEQQIYQIAEQRMAMVERLRTDPAGLSWCEAHTDLVDDITRLLYRDLENLDSLPPFALIATGGYGRRELCPWSDVDLTVVPSDEASPELDTAIRRLFQDLHWAFCTVLRLDVGYAYRLISDAPALDVSTRTGLLDMRLLAGSHDLFRQLDTALFETFSAGEFVLAKIREREFNLQRFHDTPLVVEPHLKEGAGGLRCFHCANWIRAAVGDRFARATTAYDEVIKFRNLLHLEAGRHQDLFSRSRQAEVADLLKMDVYDMMSEVAKATSSVHQEYIRAKESLRESRYALAKGVLAVQGEARLVGGVDAAEAAVGIAIATHLGLRIADIPVKSGDDIEGEEAVFALSSGEKTLRNLDRCGLLATLLPELDRCRTLMPTDNSHEFTVFEHTMRVVRLLDNLTSEGFLGGLKDSLTSVEPLYMAALLHDVGKAIDHPRHAEIGAEIVRQVCDRWSVADGLAEMVEWLVAEHLTMSRFIRIRDIANPQTIDEFVALVKDMDRLNFLTLLTWADVSAVASGAWTPSQDTFLKELHTRTASRLQGESVPVRDPALHRQRLLRQLKGKEGDQESLQRFIESLPAHYLISTPPDLMRLHMEFVAKAESGAPTVELYNRSDLGATEVTVCCLDAPAVLSKLLGVFYAYDLTVSGIRASTTITEPAVALDVFTISFAGRPIPSATSKQVTTAIMNVLDGTVNVLTLLLEKGKEPDRIQKVYSFQFIEGSPGVLEIHAPRGRGMPFRLSRLLAAQEWNVVAARVGQWAGNATGAFYILGPGGHPLSRDEVEFVVSALPH